MKENFCRGVPCVLPQDGLEQAPPLQGPEAVVRGFSLAREEGEMWSRRGASCMLPQGGLGAKPRGSGGFAPSASVYDFVIDGRVKS